MNFLAHLFLSEATPEARIGNLMGDFVKSWSPLLNTYPAPMRRGIALHHKIDAYTDAHPVFQASRRRISLERRRYASILIDIFYDHFLAAHWTEFSAQPLPDFAQSIYAALRADRNIWPESLHYVARAMIRDDWLNSYRELAGMQRALGRVSRQIKRQNDLAFATDELTNSYPLLEADFLAFFPDLTDHVQVEIELLRASEGQ